MSTDLLPRDGTVIEDFHVEDPELIYATHHINAYEENNSIVLGREIILQGHKYNYDRIIYN